MKISPNSCELSKADSEVYLGLCTLLLRPDNLIMSRIAESNDGIDVCGKPLKAKWKTLFVFF